jgi:hypothetical protein
MYRPLDSILHTSILWTIIIISEQRYPAEFFLCQKSDVFSAGKLLLEAFLQTKVDIYEGTFKSIMESVAKSLQPDLWNEWGRFLNGVLDPNPDTLDLPAGL